jgi:hypothetical protein
MKGVTICMDFDGVIHSYESGWTGLDNVDDDPVPGARSFCRWLIDKGYNIVILSTRFCDKTNDQSENVAFDAPSNIEMDSNRGMRAVRKWLDKHAFPKDIKLTATKPPANLYIDDRGFRFEGEWISIVTFLQNSPTPGTWVPRKRKE